MGTLDRVFHLSENKTDVKTEVMAGITTFMTMAYILAVNPDILSASGMDKGAVFTATCLASLIATVLMALLSNYPFVLSAGMGLNAYFAYTVVGSMGYSWQMALAAVFVEGLIFIALSLTNVREAIFNSIPMPLKRAVSAGIGLFIAFIGLQNCKLVVDSSTLVTVYSFSKNAETFRTEGITVLLAIIGVLITAILMVKKVKGGILWGILITWLLGIACELTGLYVPNAEMGFYSVMPDFSSGISIPSIMPTLGQMDFSAMFSLDFFVVIFAFLFVDMFDTLGTLIGVASKADMLDEQGRLPRIRGALLADAVGTSAGAALGTSTITTFVESASGVAEGGRTGLTGLVSAALFGLSLFLSPIFLAIPSFATAPALIIVGFLMVSSILKVDFDNLFDAIPAYIAMIAMPFMYSISEGIAMGVISYVVINIFGGAERRKTISPVMYILAVLFVLKYILL
ncbi:NCS2 family permease [uncultured Oscillibacter sp.]|uniref:NCS2 family permease n=1 Tax=uncultured Oscillibacter sp. TaxID=876091 RepID=UPI00280AB358|nr:NCS2 family permease [uncultured Oscillibacter sp.]